MKMAGIPHQSAKLLEKLRNGQLDDRADRAKLLKKLRNGQLASRSSCSTIDFLQVFRVFQSSTKCALIPEQQPQRTPFFSRKKRWKLELSAVAMCMQCFLFEVEATFIQTCIVRSRDAGCRSLQVAFYRSNESDNSWSLLRNHRKTISDQSLSVTRHVPQLFSTMWYWREKSNRSTNLKFKSTRCSSYHLESLGANNKRRHWKNACAGAAQWQLWATGTLRAGWLGECVCVYECNITPIARYQTCFNLMYRQLDVRNQSHAAFPSLWKTSLRSSYNWSLIPWHAELNRKDWKWTN